MCAGTGFPEARDEDQEEDVVRKYEDKIDCGLYHCNLDSCDHSGYLSSFQVLMHGIHCCSTSLVVEAAGWTVLLL